MRVCLRVTVRPHEDGGDVSGRQPAEPEALAPRQDRWQKQIGPRRHENEYRCGGRLFESLQQRILGLDHHGVRIIHDDDTPATLEWPVRGALDRLADLIDLDRAGLTRLDNQDVRMDTTCDSLAGCADSAGIGRGRSQAVEQLSKRDGSRALADTIRTGKDQAWRQ